MPAGMILSRCKGCAKQTDACATSLRGRSARRFYMIMSFLYAVCFRRLTA
ncbi:hypothetical protein A3768_4342 (plasmid) [Ralstonia solanacearum]|nr:hypothetical protein A3768_4342 [Ralstonia solanacearum]